LDVLGLDADARGDEAILDGPGPRAHARDQPWRDVSRIKRRPAGARSPAKPMRS
jgi:hypothetical protein